LDFVDLDKDVAVAGEGFGTIEPVEIDVGNVVSKEHNIWAV